MIVPEKNDAILVAIGSLAANGQLVEFHGELAAALKIVEVVGLLADGLIGKSKEDILFIEKIRATVSPISDRIVGKQQDKKKVH